LPGRGRAVTRRGGLVVVLAVRLSCLAVVLVAALVPIRLAGGPSPHLLAAAVAVGPSLVAVWATLTWRRLWLEARLAGPGRFAVALIVAGVPFTVAGGTVGAALLRHSVCEGAAFFAVLCLSLRAMAGAEAACGD
jgi:hypothetical protein